MKYSAIDLHSNNSVVVVTDEADHVLAFAHTAAASSSTIESMPPESATATRPVT